MGTAASNSSTAALARFLRTETVGGTALLVAAAFALAWANSPWTGGYHQLAELTAGTDGLSIAGHPIHLRLTLAEWAKDGLLAVFFFVAGLELKRELVVGELSTLKSAALPVICAAGGVIAPAVITVALAYGDPDIGTAWAIPIATDIAFALGILAITGSRLPSGARVFLLGLAVVDDLIAIAVIAVVFSTGLNLLWIGIAAALCIAYAAAQRARIRTPLLYLPLAVALWIAVLQSGIHATIAGVALGLLTRVRTGPGEQSSPAERLEHAVQPISALICVPIFAFFASGVELSGAAFGELATDRLAIAIMIGLFAGKVIGISGAGLLAVKFRIAQRPEGLYPRDMVALSVLGGIGFTVSLLVAELSLDGSRAEIAKTAVLLTSLIASIIGSILLFRRGRVHAEGQPLAP